MDPADLILDIDFICAWICNENRTYSFKVCPADLVFHNVSDFKKSVDCDDSKGGIIMDIEKDKIKNPYYKWNIDLLTPDNSFISFIATGFTLTTRKEPVLTDRQSLTCDERK